MRDPSDYWFPAKTYGWGWGMPTAWPGRLVLVAFFGLVLAGVWLFPPSKSMSVFFIYNAVLCAALTGTCWLKGEPPHWRWGDKNQDKQPRR